MSIQLSDAQKLDWLQLIRSENVGPRTFRTLVNKFGGARAVLDALPELLRASKSAKQIRIFPRDAAEREYAATRQAGGQFLALGESAYPAPLRAIADAPPLLIARGDLAIFARPAVAIIGSRNASAVGLAFAERLARAFVKERYAVVSGLARGVDAAAHRASAAAGGIGVLAGGLNRIYPADHVGLAHELSQAGAIVTEMPLEWEPRGRDFPRRNRIVSGLCLASVVVEASRRSGSLITARFAADQGRLLFATPGSPLDPRAEGTNDLLREGAMFCTRPEDVIEAVRPMIEGAGPRNGLFSDLQDTPVGEDLWDESDLFGEAPVPRTHVGWDMNEAARVFQQAEYKAPPALDPTEVIARLLGPSPVAIDDLARIAGLSAADVHRAVLELELAGKIERHGGARISARPSND